MESYERNFELWKTRFPQAAEKLSQINPSDLQFCQTEQGELNLCGGEKEFYHSQAGAKQEALKWFSQLDLSDTHVLYVYGIGLGYFYDPVKEWLAQNEDHHLVFFEDDLRVIRRFFESERAENILKDPQVDLYFFERVDEPELAFRMLSKHYLLQTFQLSSLPHYGRKKPNFLPILQTKILYYTTLGAIMGNEVMNFGEALLSNFYSNCFDLQTAFLGNGLFGHFSGFPCIICGAGPSLGKNVAVLETLNDSALILAGGTSLNALNGTKVRPHFGFGTDPNPFQIPRLMMNQAFETPFFYFNRWLREALKMVRGPRVYLSGMSSSLLAEWFEEKLNIPDHLEELGMTVTTLNLSLAKWLGCDPIILVGVDLAYSNNASYADNVVTHALHDWKWNFPTKFSQDELMETIDIEGKPIFTLWKWLHESLQISAFAHSNPSLTLINATEGGIGFKGVPNVPLKIVAGEFLTETYDISGKVHAEIHSHPMPKSVTKEKICSLMQHMRNSLETCVTIYGELRGAYQAEEKDAIEALESTLKEELAYSILLEFFGEKFTQMHQAKRDKTEVYVKQCDFLKEGCLSNIRFIDRALEKKGEEERQSATSGDVRIEQSFKEGKLHGPSLFYAEEGQLLSRSHYVEGVKQGKALHYYANGALYSEQHFVDGQWDGEQLFFYESGQKKSVLPYKKGLLDGEVVLYHKNGQLERKLHFSNGRWQGKEEWWDETGRKRIEAEYDNSEPIGVARKWDSSGQLREEVHFEGKKRRVQKWTKEGEALPEDVFERKDYFEQVAAHTEHLTHSLESVLGQLHSAKEMFSEKEEVDRLFSEVEEELKSLQEIHGQMEKEVALHPLERREEIWKTPSSRKLVDRYLKEVAKEMNATIESMQETLSDALKRLGRGK